MNIVDPKKDWYDINAPTDQQNNVDQNLTRNKKIASHCLKGRVFEGLLANHQKDEVSFRKFKMICKDVQGKNCLTD